MERNVSSLAIVLHSQRYGQHNRRLKLLTVDFGIIDALSYGAQKAHTSVKAEVFTDGRFFLYYNPVKKDYTLKDVEVLATHQELRLDLHQTYIALFFAEMIIKTHGGDSALCYRLLSQALDAMVAYPALSDRILIQFVHQMSELLGLQTDFTHCPICDRAYEEDEILSFSSSLGSPCCQGCASLDATLSLPPGARRYLCMTMTMEFPKSILVPLSPTATMRIKRYMLEYSTMICGTQLQTLSSVILWQEGKL